MNRKDFIWNAILLKVAIVFQALSATFMMITSIGIKILFNVDKKSKPKSRNTVSFKSLNIIYSLWMLIIAIPTLTNFWFGFKNNEVMPYSTSLGLNAMLFSFLRMNVEAWKFVQAKIRTWQNIREDDQKIQFEMEAHHSMWAARPNLQRNSGVHHHINDIFVIDIEP
jgi:hypothetical protein